jgi:hypothetical protein
MMRSAWALTGAGTARVWKPHAGAGGYTLSALYVRIRALSASSSASEPSEKLRVLLVAADALSRFVRDAAHDAEERGIVLPRVGKKCDPTIAGGSVPEPRPPEAAAGGRRRRPEPPEASRGGRCGTGGSRTASRKPQNFLLAPSAR